MSSVRGAKKNLSSKQLLEVRGFDHYIAQWNIQDQEDYQLRMAYLYLKVCLKLNKSQVNSQ